MQKKRSYFVQTFRINEVMLFVLLLLFLIRFPIKFIDGKFIVQAQAQGSLLYYSRIMRIVFEYMIKTIDWLILITMGVICLIIIPELICRIAKDSVFNWIRSILMTYQIRRFISRKANWVKCGRKSDIFQKSIIDIRKNSVTYLAKLPNDMESHDRYEKIKNILYTEITNQFPDYSFSQNERYKHWIRIKGTKII